MATWKVVDGELTVDDQDVTLRKRGGVTHIARTDIRSADVSKVISGGCLWLGLWFIPILWPILFIAWLQQRNRRVVILRTGTGGANSLAFVTEIKIWPEINEALALGL